MANAVPSTQTNKQYSLNYRDALRGLLVAVLTATLTAILDALNVNGIDHLNWKAVGIIGLTAGISYLVKNFFTPTEIVVVNPPQQAVSAVESGAPIKVGTTTVAAKSNPQDIQ